jgi:hypothetical protein
LLNCSVEEEVIAKKKSSTWRRFYTCQWFFLGATSSGRKYLVQCEPDIFLGLLLNCWRESEQTVIGACRFFFFFLGVRRVYVFLYAEIVTDMAQWLEVSWVRFIKLFFGTMRFIKLIFHLFFFFFGYN